MVFDLRGNLTQNLGRLHRCAIGLRTKHEDLTFICKLDRIAQKVHEHLNETVGITPTFGIFWFSA